MATVAFSQSRRRKPATYGKASRTASSWSATDFHDDDHSTLIPVVQRPKAYVEQQGQPIRHAKLQSSRTIKPRTKTFKDSWDVPSSDDEAELSPIKRTSPPRHLVKRNLVNLAEEPEAILAPWEKSKTIEVKAQQIGDIDKPKAFATSSDAQLQAEFESCLKRQKQSPEKARSSVQNATSQDVQIEASVPSFTSAAARLQAKKAKEGNWTSPAGPGISNTPGRVLKRGSGPEIHSATATPRKRQRPEQSVRADADSQMYDAVRAPVCDKVPSIHVEAAAEPTNIYDIPDSSADELASTGNLARPAQSRVRRGKITKYSSPRMLDSAPARLIDMLPSDTDDTDTTSRSPSATPSRPSTPRRPTTTGSTTTPETARKDTGLMTPRQAELWDRLLPSENVAPSPSVLHMQDLTLKSRRKPVMATASTLRRFSSEAGPRRRTKLVDRLKSSKPSTEDEMTESDDGSSTSGLDSDASAMDLDTLNEDVMISTLKNPSQSQSQSQGAGSKSGLKVTYGSRPRTYLPEDSFEDNLLLDMQDDTPRRGAGSAKESSQKSVFDMEDSEDEGGGKLRTVHELRAVGGARRFMDDIAGLLDDISNHNASGRSRRRSALIELASKLYDEVFAERFFRQGFEQKLLVECNAAPDVIADPALAAAFTIVMSGEHPEPLAQSLKDGGALSWSARLLDDRTDPRVAAKERRSNMSKSAQATFVDFMTDFAGRDAVWDDRKPVVVTPRIIALKVCDLIVGKLRRAGDTSELMSASEIRQLVPGPSDISDTSDASAIRHITLAISVLESLSTAALSLNWPADVTEQLRELFLSPILSRADSQHLLFLALRLVTNLTNENSRNCKAFSQPSVVLCILHMISDGFSKLHADVDEAQRTINLDILVLSTGILINLTEYNDNAREYTTTIEAAPVLSGLVDVFQRGQRRMLDAESEEQGVTNVVYGYLAVVLANLCRNSSAKALISSRLPNHSLAVLIDALAEFVAHHQRVDTQNFEGEEGAATWSAHTDRLIGVLARLKAEA